MGVERIKLPPALALLLRPDLARPRQRLRERLFQRRPACNLAADVANEPAEPRAQQAQLAMMALELLGVGVAPRHHRRPLSDARIGLAQLDPVPAGKPPEPPDRRMQELGVGRERDRLRLHGRVRGDALEVLRAERARVMRHAQALGQKQIELVAEPLAPVAQVRALVRECMLEKLLPGEVLEIRVVDPALADLFVGQREDVLEKQNPDHEPRLDPRPPRLGIERRDLAVEPVPVDPLRKQHQLVPHVDDLIEPGPEQIARIRWGMLLRPHRAPSASSLAKESRPAIRMNPAHAISHAVSNPKCNRAA